MCRGLQEERKNLNQGSFCRRVDKEDYSDEEETSNIACCELCGVRASLYCQADDAYLCRKCDKWVHEANFLALRHIRCFLCNTCQNLTQRYLVGASTEMVLPTIVSLREGKTRQCNNSGNSDDKECSTSLKMPFLFL